MKTLFVLAIMTLTLLGAPASSIAQTTSAEVTVKVPVNLTQVGPDVAKVRVACELFSLALTNGTGREISGEPGASNPERYLPKYQEFSVSGGQVGTTASLVYSAQLNNPVGQPASLVCYLQGWSTSAQSWLGFGATAVNPSFKVTATSTTESGQGFVW